MIHFIKNVAILGGLLQVVAFGAGRYSLDHGFGRSAELSTAALTTAL
jgi:putative oxidoreductase